MNTNSITTKALAIASCLLISSTLSFNVLALDKPMTTETGKMQPAGAADKAQPMNKMSSEGAMQAPKTKVTTTTVTKTTTRWSYRREAREVRKIMKIGNNAQIASNWLVNGLGYTKTTTTTPAGVTVTVFTKPTSNIKGLPASITMFSNSSSSKIIKIITKR